jgi:hypothetical protein
MAYFMCNIFETYMKISLLAEVSIATSPLINIAASTPSSAAPSSLPSLCPHSAAIPSAPCSPTSPEEGNKSALGLPYFAIMFAFSSLPLLSS